MITIDLPEPWFARGLDFAERLVDLYKDRPDYPTLTNGIDRDVPTIAHSKRAEAAFALMHGLDPEAAIKWSITIEGKRHHWDVLLRSRRVDVKTVKDLYAECFLMWPIGKWRDFERAEFDVLALMSGKGARFVWHGWVSKDQFRRGHHLAGGDVPLDRGTPYMRDCELEGTVLWPDCP